MKKEILVVFSLAMGICNCLMGQNLFTAGDNGTFESEGSDALFAPNSRSNDYSYSGNYSLKISNYSWFNTSSDIQTGEPYVEGTVKIPIGSAPLLIKKDVLYEFRLRIYIPSSKLRRAYLHNSLGGVDNTAYCAEEESIVNDAFSITEETYEWVELRVFERVYNDVSLNEIDLVLSWYHSTAMKNCYIDKLEIIEYPKIEDNAVINGSDITLNPVGGYPVELIPPTEYPQFSYQWSDGSNQKDRTGLTGSVSVMIYQKYLRSRGGPGFFQDYCHARKFEYNLSPCVDNEIICSSVATTLTATCAPEGATYEWYDSPALERLVSTNSSFQAGPFSQPGEYKYYVVFVKNGGRSISTEATITVTGPAPGLNLNSYIVISGRELLFTAQSHQSSYQYEYFFQYGVGDDLIEEKVTTDQASLSYTFEDKGAGYPALGLHNIRVRVTEGDGCSSSFDFEVIVKEIEPLCEVTIPLVATTDDFSLDKFSGRFVTRRNCDVDISLGCIQAKPQAPQFTNVVSAAATTYSDEWDYTYLSAQTGNDYENGQRGKWRPQASYAYNVPINYQATPENHRAGTFSLSHFNWQYPAASTKSGWLKTNTIEYYSPHGDPVQERNALNVASVAKFGYGGAVPYLIAQNAEYEQVMFESFESVTFEDGVSTTGGSRTSANAHAGTYSLQLTGTFTSRTIAAKGKNIQVRFWLKGDVSTLQVTSSSGTTISGGLNKVASSGFWTLYEAIILPGSSQSVTVSLIKQAGSAIWIDDVRLQPMDAAMTCYVYEVGTLRLLTVFDDQHFGLYYQYNDEGKLVRKQVETERGLKTIQETQYNLPQQDKNPQ